MQEPKTALALTPVQHHVALEQRQGRQLQQAAYLVSCWHPAVPAAVLLAGGASAERQLKRQHSARVQYGAAAVALLGRQSCLAATQPFAANGLELLLLCPGRRQPSWRQSTRGAPRRMQLVWPGTPTGRAADSAAMCGHNQH